MKNIIRDFSLSTFVAGLIAVLVGYTSTAVMVFQAATASGVGPADTGSWLGIISVAAGLLTIFLSTKYKMPVMFTWSTPGAALLITNVAGFTLPEMIGVFVFSASLIFLAGATGLFEKIMNKIPVGIVSAMLAGILLHFAFEIFVSMKTQMLLVFVMLIAYMFGRRFFPRYNIIVVLCLGIMLAWLQNLMHFGPVDFSLLHPTFTKPEFNFASLISIGIPLFVVTMTSQNMTGVAVMKAYDYKPRVSNFLAWSGFINLITAPFGSFALNLSALTAAMCMGPESHPDKEKRYTAAISMGLLYILIGLFSSAIVGIFVAFPKELIMTIAGLALISTINNGLIAAVHHEADREASMITFFVTASGVSLFGIGAAFWGLVAGYIFSVILKLKRKGE